MFSDIERDNDDERDDMNAKLEHFHMFSDIGDDDSRIVKSMIVTPRDPARARPVRAQTRHMHTTYQTSKTRDI